ncbi:MAG: TetR/AcrR family transcriptional regulator [Thermoanaerobaculia bacterium]|nr:TetR/AcrR family transcriptional regulator [Thermoanaerobaculia bacterium]
MTKATNTTRSEPQWSSRKEEIVDRAFEIALESGFAGLRMRLLAERVGVTEGALYRHFSNKEAILLALAARIEGRLLVPIRKIASGAEDSPREKLEKILRHHVRTLIETRSLPLLLVGEASFSEHEELRLRMGGIISSYQSILSTLVGQVGGQGEGELEPREMALLLMGLPAAVALSHPLLPDEKLESRLVDYVVPEYVRLLLPGERRSV